MGVKVTNNAFGTISAGINSSATTVTLDSGQGARFPTLGGSDHFYGTLIDTSNNVEIIKVTARSTDSMTVVRAQDNTTAQAFAIGDRFELRPTAALFEDILSEGLVIPDNAVTLAKMASGTDGNIISYDASGNPVAVATGNAGQVLTSAGAGAPPTFAAAAGGGKILQAVTTFNNTHISQSNNTEYTQITTSITPSASTSKVLVMVSLGGVSHSSTLDSGYIIKRDISGGSATELEIGQGASGRNVTFLGTHNTGSSEGVSASCQLLDSPNTTSAVEYKVFGLINSGTFILNKRGGDTTSCAGSRMVLMEVGA